MLPTLNIVLISTKGIMQDPLSRLDSCIVILHQEHRNSKHSINLKLMRASKNKTQYNILSHTI